MINTCWSVQEQIISVWSMILERGWRLKSSSFSALPLVLRFLKHIQASDDSTRSTWDPKLFLVSQLPNYISSTHSHFPPARRLLHQYPSTRVNQTLTIQRLLSWWQMATEKITPDSKKLVFSTLPNSLWKTDQFDWMVSTPSWLQRGCLKCKDPIQKVLLVLSGWYTSIKFNSQKCP